MTKKYILSIVASMGFFSRMEASSPEEFEEKKTSKGVIFYGYGDLKKSDNGKDQQKINTSSLSSKHSENAYEYLSFGSNFSFEMDEENNIVENTPPEKTKAESIFGENKKKSFAKSPPIPINRELSTFRGKSPQNIHKVEIASSSKIGGEKKFSFEENKKTTINSIPKSPSILFRNSVERVSTTNAFTVGSPSKSRKIQKSLTEENPISRHIIKTSEIQKNENKLREKKSSKQDDSLIFQFEVEENEDEKDDEEKDEN